MKFCILLLAATCLAPSARAEDYLFGELTEVCTYWTEYNSNKQIYDAQKSELSQSGVDIDDVSPEQKRNVMAAKAKYERAKAKYTKVKKKAFNPKSCSQ